MLKFDHPFLRLPRRYCAETIAAEVAAIGPSAWVPHPGNIPGNDALLLITPEGQITNGFTGPMAPTEYLDRMPYVMEIMADLGGVWGRSRFMGLMPGARVPDHVDINYYWRTHLRIHIPVVTNPRVTFTCGGESVHMQAGECWLFDSFRMHNVHNGGTEKRLHLVLDTVGGEGLFDLIDAAQQGAAPPAEALKRGERRIDQLAYEQVNVPTVMSAWEVRCHIDYILQHVPAGPHRAAADRRLHRFADSWAAAWAQFGAAERGLPAYRAIIAKMEQDLARMGAGRILLLNQVPLDRTLSELIFRVALPAAPAQPAAGFGLPARRLAS